MLPDDYAEFGKFAREHQGAFQAGAPFPDWGCHPCHPLIPKDISARALLASRRIGPPSPAPRWPNSAHARSRGTTRRKRASRFSWVRRQSGL